MVRFLHMADMQLGMRAQDATEVGERLRDARFDTLKRCMELAESQEVDTPQRKGLDYVALGHWHDMRIYESNRLAYPYTPEQTSFGEHRASHVLEVAIERAGHLPEVTPHEVGRLA